MRAVIEKEKALITHETVLVIIAYFVVFIRNIHGHRRTVNVQCSCDNKAYQYTEADSESFGGGGV